jgi:hypothetical protein
MRRTAPTSACGRRWPAGGGGGKFSLVKGEDNGRIWWKVLLVLYTSWSSFMWYSPEKKNRHKSLCTIALWEISMVFI